MLDVRNLFFLINNSQSLSVDTRGDLQQKCLRFVPFYSLYSDVSEYRICTAGYSRICTAGFFRVCTAGSAKFELQGSAEYVLYSAENKIRVLQNKFISIMRNFKSGAH